jgi:hypothetical protein
MQRPDERELREELTRLRAEHRDLDAQIVAEEASAPQEAQAGPEGPYQGGRKPAAA